MTSTMNALALGILLLLHEAVALSDSDRHPSAISSLIALPDKYDQSPVLCCPQR